MLISKPNRARANGVKAVLDLCGDVTLVALRPYNCLDVKRKEGLLRANVGSITVVIGYASPNQAIDNFTNFLNRMEQLVRTANREVLVCGNLNAKSPM